MSTCTLNILGCGSAKPSVRHNQSCTVLNFREALYMIDCGEGAQQQMQRMGLKFSRLRHIFLTHLHGDHILGLPGLLQTLSLNGHCGRVTIHTFREGIRSDMNLAMSWNMMSWSRRGEWYSTLTRSR